MKENGSWESIDKSLGGFVKVSVYTVLFLNDQVYNFEMQLYDCIRKNGLYKHRVKKLVNDMDRFIKAYNSEINHIARFNPEAMAIITQSMEDDVYKHIERYKYSVSQVLHNVDCHGDMNLILSICSTIDMLCQTSTITIKDFFEVMKHKTHISYNPIRYLSMERMNYLVREITNELTPKNVYVNLNDLPEISTAFQAIANNMLRADVFERAFAECDSIVK